jgi:hypothetical protein
MAEVVDIDRLGITIIMVAALVGVVKQEKRVGIRQAVELGLTSPFPFVLSPVDTCAERADAYERT